MTQSQAQARFLRPLAAEFASKEIWVFDIESKNDDSQQKGFTRPFLLGFDDGSCYRAFENSPALQSQPENWQIAHLCAGGMVDQFMRFVLGDYPGGDPQRYQSARGAIYSHNGGRFDELFVLGWLVHQSRYFFEIASVQSRIQRLDVWPAGTEKKEGFWTFLDSVSLLPMSLKKIGETFCPERAGKMGMDLDLPEKTIAVEIKRPIATPRLPKECFGIIVNGQVVPSHLLDTAPAKSLLAFARWPPNLPLEAFNSEPFDLWERYNRIDCEVLRAGLLRFSNLIGQLGTDIGITTPSTSMKLFRRKFQSGQWMPRNAHLTACDGLCRRTDGVDGGCGRLACDGLCHGCAHDFIRKGFYGGRTELFEERAKTVYYFDLNSSYPAVMQFDMPFGPAMEFMQPTLAHCKRMARKHIGFVEATVEIPPDCPIPPLPYRTEGGECLVDAGPGKPKRPMPARKLLFPAGRFSGVWDFEELMLLYHPLVRGRIVSIGRSLWYKKKPVFRKMVQTLYAYRKKHVKGCASVGCKGCNPLYSPGMSETAKLMGNSFFGKTGMREERTSLIFLPQGEDFRSVEHGWPIDGEPETCRIWEVERIASAPYVMPQYAAHITALARIRLFMGMMDVLGRGGRVLYCDTDSIIATIPLSENLIDPNMLGKWKNEHPGIKIEGLFVLPKLYQLRAHQDDCCDPLCGGCRMAFHLSGCKDKACKGCSVTKQRMKGVGGNQTAQVFEDLVSRDPSRAVSFERVVQHKTMLKKHLLAVTALKDDRPLGGDDLRATKTIRTYYDKRVMDDRGRSRPIAFGLA